MLNDVDNTLEMTLPLITEVQYDDPCSFFHHFAEEEWSLLLDSADGVKTAYGTNRFSYIAIDPFKHLIFKNSQLFINGHLENATDPLMALKEHAHQHELTCHAGLAPFQGGVAGLLSYDLCHFYEDIPRTKIVDKELVDMAVGFYDLVHAFDHQSQKSWLFSSGLPFTDPNQRREHAEKRMNFYLNRIAANNKTKRYRPFNIQKGSRSNFDKTGYTQAVSKAIEYIKSGDIFEVNLSQRFELDLPTDCDPFSLFLKIKEINPSPFSAYLNLGYTKIISASPERFIEVNNGQVETRPIKGTRKRSLDPVEDDRLARELITSNKDRAENIMIVDLMRNDLSHVCEDDSITVPQLCGHEIYPRVHHLVSVIKGVLKPQFDAFDLLRSSFPGGSITGAPKIRAMQIISELEPHQRGPYCGSVFLASFDGLIMDSSIIIRSYVIQGKLISFHGGGAVTIDSDPVEEYEETLAKINVLKEALEYI